MIALSYSCVCGVPLPTLDDAQTHADRTAHTVDVHGRVTQRCAAPYTARQRDQQELRRLEREIARLKATQR